MTLIACDISCDENSPYWTATLVLSDLNEFASKSVGDAFSVTLQSETFNLILDSKTLSRQSAAAPVYQWHGLSPLALFDAPYAQKTTVTYDQATLASVIVQELIGSVTWNLPDWIVPAGALALDNVTPLQAARSILAAIGGLIESQPDGTVICRLAHPVNIPDYPSTAAAFELFDDQVITSNTAYAALIGFNRVTVSNDIESQNTDADRLEYEAIDDYSGTVRGYLKTKRPVVLVHSGHPDTIITPLGYQTRTLTERVEFIDGEAQTQYPIHSIQSTDWQHDDLGNVTANGQTLTAAIAGYSLLNITYVIESLDYAVALAIDEEVQFILVEQ